MLTTATLLGVVMIITTSLLHNLPLTIAANTNTGPLDSDRKNLLFFSNALSRVGPKLNWMPEDKVEDICKKWIGITCTHSMADSSTAGKAKLADPNRVGAIQLPGQGLYGPIAPNSIGKLDALENFHLKHNSLYGSIPPDIFHIPSLISINLQDNKLCGDLPVFHNHPPNLLVVDLSKNSFTGPISSIFGKTTKLKYLNLSINMFSGNIPHFEELKLDILDLSHNELDGPIPAPFQRFPLDSFGENPRLCGKPLTNYCPVQPPAYPPSITAAHSNKLGAIALLGSSTILLLIL